MSLKYESEISKVEWCPPANASPRTFRGFRFVHRAIDDKRNFLPAAILNPRRTFLKLHVRCSSFALSMFDTRDNAKNRYESLRMAFQRINRTIGTHLAEGNLTDADGAATPPDSSGHFDLFEDSASRVSAKFRIIEDLFNADS